MTYEDRFTLEKLSERVGVKPRTIRDYRQRGLLPPAQRKGNQLLFGDRHVEALRRVLALQRRGLNLAAIKAVLGDTSGDEGVCRGIRFLAICDPGALRVLTRWRIVRDAGGAGEYEWIGGKGLLAALKRLGERDVGVAGGLCLVAGLLEIDLIGSGPIVNLLRRVETAAGAVPLRHLVRLEEFHDLVGQLVRWQLGMWSGGTCHRSMSPLDSRAR